MIDLAQRLGPVPLMAVLRAPTADGFLWAAEVLQRAGFRGIELTLTSDGALAGITALRERYGDEFVAGAGTVRTAADARRAIEAGAQFVVSQITDEGVHQLAESHNVVHVPGALTPNEIVRAWQLGVQLVKVSPIGPLGGLDYLDELRGPLPDVQLFPTGGVPVDQVGDYLSRGARVVGVSRDLFRDSLEPGGHRSEQSGLAARARHAVALATEATQFIEAPQSTDAHHRDPIPVSTSRKIS